MGILNTLKNLFIPEQPVEIETIKLNEIGQWIVKSKADLEIINSQFVASIKEVMGSFSIDFSQKIGLLEQVDLDKFKIEERGRKLVEENYKNYLDHVRRLKDEIEEIRVVDSILVIDQINLIFENFGKKSNTNFQKASILIGNELGAVRESMGKFSRDIKQLIDTHKDYFKKNEILGLIEKDLGEIKDFRSQESNIYENIKTLDRDIETIKKDIDNLNEEINDIKESEAYINNLRNISKLDELKLKYDKLVYGLKEMVNFKGLSNFFHINKNDMEILNKFKNNFKENYSLDSDKLISLLNESKLMNSGIQEVIINIKNLNEEIGDIQIERDETNELVFKIDRGNNKIDDYKAKIAKENKKLIRVRESIIGVEKQMIGKLREANVEVLV